MWKPMLLARRIGKTSLSSIFPRVAGMDGSELAQPAWTAVYWSAEVCLQAAFVDPSRRLTFVVGFLECGMPRRLNLWNWIFLDPHGGYHASSQTKPVIQTSSGSKGTMFGSWRGQQPLPCCQYLLYQHCELLGAPCSQNYCSNVQRFQQH